MGDVVIQTGLVSDLHFCHLDSELPNHLNHVHLPLLLWTQLPLPILNTPPTPTVNRSPPSNCKHTSLSHRLYDIFSTISTTYLKFH